jgi:hypothetical protein
MKPVNRTRLPDKDCKRDEGFNSRGVATKNSLNLKTKTVESGLTGWAKQGVESKIATINARLRWTHSCDARRLDNSVVFVDRGDGKA